MARIEQAVGEDFTGTVQCSCGEELVGGEYPENVKIVDRICLKCWDEDHPQPPAPEPDYGPVPDYDWLDA